MPYATPAALILISAIAYVVGFEVNQLLFWHSEVFYSTHWIFIPSGIRLLAVLILAEYGALGIILGTFFCDWFFVEAIEWLDIMTKALISGLAPLLARQLSIRFLNLQPNLTGLNAQALLKLSVVFALTSSSLHQLWFMLNHHNNNFVDALMVMSLGDWLGSALVLAMMSALLGVYKNFQQRDFY